MGYTLLTTSYSFRYYLLLANNYGGYCNITNFSIQHGKNGSLVNGTGIYQVIPTVLIYVLIITGLTKHI